MFRLCTFLSMVLAVRAKFEKIDSGDSYADIEKFAHTACLQITCVKKEVTLYETCGASVLNQLFLLTAAHCLLLGCIHTNITISLGSRQCGKGVIRHAIKFVTYENYREFPFLHDIAIIQMSSPVPLKASIGRVAVMRYPPDYHNVTAQIAGWGGISVEPFISTDYLKFLNIKVWKMSECDHFYEGHARNLPPGFICGSAAEYTSRDENYFGDSGSALVVYGYIQIGIASYGNEAGPNFNMYTDVTYHYNWIRKWTRNLRCE